MYHYIRNNEDYSYDCFGRRKEEFEAQINFFKKNGEVINPGDLEKVFYYIKNDSLNAFMLSFDDGYKDHLYCANFLKSENLNGIFFPPINSQKGELLDVNLIHILLGTRNIDKNKILNHISYLCNQESILLHLENKKVCIEEYINGFSEKSNKDSHINFLIKKILQRDIIDVSKRKKICKQIFFEMTGKGIESEANKLYLNNDEMRQMRSDGMIFGSHGLNHFWLNYLNKSEQEVEIYKSIEYLKEKKLILKNDPLVMCYPYGGYNSETLQIVEHLNIDYSLTTKIGSTDSSSYRSKHELSRWDTNHCWDNDYRKPIHPQK